VNIVIVTYDWPPYADSVGSCQRMVYFARYLRDVGENVVVVAAKGHEEMDGGLVEAAGSISVEWAPSRVQSWRVARKNIVASKARSSLTHRIKGRILGFAKRCIRAVPLSYVVFDLQAFRGAILRAAARLTCGVDVVYISGPPHGLFVLSLMLRRLLGRRVTVVLDYRDGWNTQSVHQRNNRVAAWVEKRLELACLRKADLVTHASPALPQMFHERFGIELPRGLAVMNGWWHRPSRAASMPAAGDPPTIGYFGLANVGLGGFNDHSCLLEAAEQCVDGGCPVRFTYYGSLERADSHELPPWVSTHKGIPPADAANHMQDMDALAVVHTEASSGREVLAGKIFDYARAGRPILCVAEPDAAMSRFVLDNGLGWVVRPGDIGEIADLLKGLAVISRAWVPPPEDTLSGFSRTSQYARCHERIRMLVREHSSNVE
jgi:glycosyltransferase involved in cell wall biosynthesis